MQETIRMRIMLILASHRGRENAIPRKELADKLQRFGISIDDRKLRAIYATLAVASCEDGIFIPRTLAEVEAYREYLRPHMSAEKVQARVTILTTTLKLADAGKQLEMFDGSRAEAQP